VCGLRLDEALAAIDAANSADPNRVDWQGEARPRAQLQGRLATEWLARLSPDPTDAVVLAARAHHLERWAIARDSYPEGRAGYLRWRRALKQHSAARLAALVPDLDPATVARAAALVQRLGLGSDPDAQVVEDVACLVFLETDFEALAARLTRERLVNAVVKTAAKMSDAAKGLAGETRMSPKALAAFLEALNGG
jgi:hypothetical protein